jgi:hypothetical protein
MAPRIQSNETPSANNDRRGDDQQRSSVERPATKDESDEVGPDGGYGGSGPDQGRPER